MVYLSFLVFLFGMVVVFRVNKHLMGIFIGIEMAGLGVIFMASLTLSNCIWVVFLVMCLGVCEASLCLSLLVMVMRLCGSDLTSNLSGN